MAIPSPKPRWDLLLVLFVSSIGTSLFMAGLPLYLINMGLSSAEVASIIALTALPNLLLGSKLGRWIDVAKRDTLFLKLSFLLATVELSLVYFLPMTSQSTRPWWALIIMQLFALMFSPLTTLVYQYLIPSLHSDETKIFAIWEFISAGAAVVAAGFSYIFLSRYAVEILLVIDACTFLFAGVATSFLWKPSTPSEDSSTKVKFSISARSIVLADRTLLGAGLGMIVVAFSVHSIEANTTLINFRELGLSTASSVAVAASLGAVAASSAWVIQRKSIWVANNLWDLQKYCLISYAIVLGFLALALYVQNGFLAVVSILIGALIEPIWSVTNTRILRARTPEGRYGEVHGLLRMPRALFTIIGASLVGWSQDREELWKFALISAILVLLTNAVLQIIVSTRPTLH